MSTLTRTVQAHRYPLLVSIDLTTEFLSDLLVSCVEGGSRYWLACNALATAADQSYLVLGPADAESGEPFDVGQFDPPFLPHRDEPITITTIFRGCQRLCDLSADLKIHQTVLDRLRGAVMSVDAGNFDAGDADVILQLGYFGSVIYG